jgi:hypothetical protein
MNMAATRLAILAMTVSACSSQFAHGQPASITISIVQPTTGALAGDALNVVVTIASTFEVAKVVAEVEGRQTNLVFSSTAYSLRGQPMPGWMGALSLSSLARGPKTLTTTATDVFNNSAQAQVTFVYDRKPVLILTAPLAQTVARSQLHVAASCTDDDPAGCSLTVSVAQSSTRVQIAAGHNSIDQTVSLANYDGSQIILTFQATDSAGQTVSQDVPVYVESSERLNEAASVSGAIWDVEPDRILFLEARSDRNVLKIRQRATDQDNVVMDQSGLYPQYGYLTPKGAMFLEQSGDVLTALVYDERDGTLVELGFPNSKQSLVAKGNYAIWSSGTTLILRNLVAGTNTIVSGQAGNWMNDVAPNGDVVYWGSSYNIFRYQAGQTAQLTKDDQSTYPLTDGINVVYRKFNGGLFLHDGVHEIELAPGPRPEPNPGADYQLAGGWAAYTRLGTGGQLQVWTRSPTGEETQTTYYGDSSRISALAPNGQLMFLHGRRYLSTTGQQTLNINSSLGNIFWQGNDWWVTIGRTLFKVNTAAIPIIGDLFRTTTGQFGFQVSAADGQTVVVQASVDLIGWQDLQTNAVAGTGFIFKDEASAALAHRFYRVVTP